ncbi:MAG: response regulator [Blastocatellia bacterium]
MSTVSDSYSKFVLVADDDPSILQLIKAIVEGEGFIAVTAQNGKEAYKILQSGGPIVGAIVDVMMPYISGDELVKHMRSDESLMKIPVIMMTAEHSPKISSKSFSSGALAFLPKPFSNAQLKLMLKTFMVKQ